MRVARFLHLAVVGDYYDAWQLPVAPLSRARLPQRRRARPHLLPRSARRGRALGRLSRLRVQAGSVLRLPGRRRRPRTPWRAWSSAPTASTSSTSPRPITASAASSAVSSSISTSAEACRRRRNSHYACARHDDRELLPARGTDARTRLVARDGRRGDLRRAAARRRRLRRCSSTCRTASASRSSATSSRSSSPIASRGASTRRSRRSST